MMTASPSRITALILFLFLTLKLLPIEGGHSSFPSKAASSFHVLKNHDCSGKKVHDELSEAHHCTLCHRHSPTEAYRTLIVTVSRVVVGSTPIIEPTHREPKDFFKASSKRGPPVA
ncbi:MAG TPA: hypothetical protein VNN76_05260 [Bacteroidota bacterium]|nr:hypothetical protein [Bacteroidota bacterium]